MGRRGAGATMSVGSWASGTPRTLQSRSLWRELTSSLRSRRTSSSPVRLPLTEPGTAGGTGGWQPRNRINLIEPRPGGGQGRPAVRVVEGRTLDGVWCHDYRRRLLPGVQVTKAASVTALLWIEVFRRRSQGSRDATSPNGLTDAAMHQTPAPRRGFLL
jgi:hypothetical protein